ncbi:hypothetical protein DBR11_11915 [Pedobacter sp. HMWF019]|nr:hypothetical protein DBR11_11915 [Pedobacter sp. HMWF019]
MKSRNKFGVCKEALAGLAPFRGLSRRSLETDTKFISIQHQQKKSGRKSGSIISIIKQRN